MVRRLGLIILVCAACAGLAYGEAGAALSAGKISTWTEGRARVFVLEGDAGIVSNGGRLSGDAMAAWFDEAAAAKSGKLTLRVYSETGGVGAVTVITATGSLSVDDSALTAYTGRQESAFYARAANALAAERGTQEAPPSPAPSTDTPEDISSTSSQVPGSARQAPAPTGGEAAEGGKKAERERVGTPAGTLIPMEAIPRGTKAEITYEPIDADKYDMETEVIGKTTQIVITGGIEIGLVGYKMRAGNMVIRMTEAEEGKVGQVQIYAEDNVKFITPAATLEASRLFYNSVDDTATLVDAEVYAQLTKEGIPLVIRADRVRSYAGALYKADNAYATTCEFGRPHYRLAAKSASVIPVKHPDGTESALVVAKDTKFVVQDTTLIWWPQVSRDITDVYSPLRRVQAGNSRRFGDYAYTTWGLFDFLGGTSSESWAARMSRWSDLTGSLDYRAKRGTGTGLDYTYDTGETRGKATTYYIKDRGRDGDGFVPPSDDRGRAKWQQRTVYEGYQVDTELYHISDRGFLNEYYNRDAKEEKEPETYLYVKRPWERAQAEFLYRARLNDFQTQTEYLPQGRFDVLGWGLWDGAVLYSSTTTADNARFRPDEALAARPYQTQRFDTKHIFDAPLATPWGLTVTPFTTARESYFNKDAGGERADRFAGSWGAKVSLPPLWKVYDYSSRMFDINRVRHIVNFDVVYEDVYNSTRRPTELLQFDEIDAVRETKVATLALRQRLQTKREAARERDAPRTVDIWAWDAEADYFGDASDNGGKSWSDLRVNSRSAVTDDISIVTDSTYDTYESRFDKAGVWVRMDHSPRTVLAAGHRYIRSVSNAVMTASVDHTITDRWGISFITQYDFDHGQMLDERFVLRRNMHEFALEIDVSYDKGRGDTSVGVNVYPLVAGGVRRF